LLVFNTNIDKVLQGRLMSHIIIFNYDEQ
jgi:hypothetical protein